MNPHITRCLAEQQQCLDQLGGPHDAGARLGLSDWLLEECFVRCDEEEALP